MIQNLFDNVRAKRLADKRAREYRDLIRREAVIGGQIFGAIPKGHRREFFCLDEHAWVWHEEWTDAHGNHNVITTRYDIRPHGVFKAQDGQPYQPITPQEAKHLYDAIKLYLKRVKFEIYGIAEY